METNSIQPANRVAQVKEYYFSKKLKEVARLNAAGMDIISLGIGGPDRPPHKSVVEELCMSASRPDTHSYQPYVGLPELRKAYAAWYRNWYGVELNPDTEIQPLIGSKEGILHITLAFVNPGDGVLVPNPGYPTYSSVSKLAEAEVYTYNLKEDAGCILILMSWRDCPWKKSSSCGLIIRICRPEQQHRKNCMSGLSILEKNTTL